MIEGKTRRQAAKKRPRLVRDCSHSCGTVETRCPAEQLIQVMFVLYRITDHCRSQLRRLCFAGASAVLAALAVYGHLEGSVGALPAPLAVALFYGTAVVLSGLVTTYFLPRIRRLIEAVAVTRLVTAACVLVVPELGPQLASAPFANATLTVGGAILLLAAAPVLHRLCEGPRTPLAVQAVAAGAHEGAMWIDNPPLSRGA